MYEIIPLFAGVLIGFGLARVGPRDTRFRVAIMAVLAAAIGLFAAWVSGELAESWAFALWDGAQVVVAATLTILLVARLDHRSRAARSH